MGYTVYILISEKDGSFYIGQTNNLEARLERHNRGYELYTRSKLPWKVYWSETFETRSLAIKQERKLKSIKSRQGIIAFVEQGGSSSETSQI